MADRSLGDLARETFAAPRVAASHLLGLGLPRRVMVEGALLLATVNGLLAAATGGVVLPSQDGSEIVLGGLPWAAVLLGATILSASALQVVGRLLGGSGSFDGALLVTVWINALGLAIELASLALAVVSAALAVALFALGAVLLLWALANFVRVLHGFEGLGRSIVVILLAGVVTLLGLSVLLSIALTFGEVPHV